MHMDLFIHVFLHIIILIYSLSISVLSFVFRNVNENIDPILKLLQIQQFLQAAIFISTQFEHKSHNTNRHYTFKNAYSMSHAGHFCLIFDKYHTVQVPRTSRRTPIALLLSIAIYSFVGKFLEYCCPRNRNRNRLKGQESDSNQLQRKVSYNLHINDI